MARDADWTDGRLGPAWKEHYALGRMTTQATWDRLYVQNHAGGGSHGLGTWLAAAKDRGKKLAVSEWRLWGNDGGPADDVVYIESMYRFFKETAADIEYESYFNCASRHELFRPPSSRRPACAISSSGRRATRLR